MIHIYGIPNCDTIKKSLDWLKDKKVEFAFHDYRKEAVPASKIAAWSKAVGREVLLNKKSTTWKALTAAEQEMAATEKGAVKLLKEHITLVKRPVVEWPSGKITAGFSEETFSSLV